jgi:hypothetical protein
MPVIKTKGAASSQGFGEFAKSGAATYIEDVFSTWLYTGTGAAQTITNNIDLSTKGGLTWIKSRSAATNNNLFDTTQGATKLLHSNTADSTVTDANSLTAFNTTGFTLGTGNTAGNQVNTSAATYVSWSFRKQPKFFDVVTYTGTGANTTIAHSLGSVPGCIIVKRTDTTGAWQVYHRSNANTQYLVLNSTAGVATGATRWNSTTPTSTVFSLGTDTTVNASGGTYVAYIFAHDAGGFGLTGTDNVISCGSFTTNGSGVANVTLGYEPQFVLVKPSSTVNDWITLDTMRGFTVSAQTQMLKPNTSDAEANLGADGGPNATGFAVNGIWVNTTLIYIAIRRGPMKVPTLGTSVFSPIAVNAMQGTQQTTNFPVDMQLIANRGGETRNFSAVDRLRGVSTTTTSKYLGNITSSTDAESTSVVFATQNWNSTGFAISANTAETTALFYSFKRAPGFFDEVCYTGTGGGANAYLDVSHNLGVTPEMIIVKQRDAVNATTPYDWPVYQTAITTNGVGTAWLVGNAAKTTDYVWRRGASGQKIDASTFSLNGNYLMSNQSGGTYVAYLFATCAGVSKVGSYTGTGATQTISCGFTGGARFVLVKRTDSTGDWYVWDTARGMVSGTDPSLLLNTTAAEVNANSIYTATGGFQIVSTAAGINASGGSYIFLAIS